MAHISKYNRWARQEREERRRLSREQREKKAREWEAKMESSVESKAEVVVVIEAPSSEGAVLPTQEVPAE